MNFGFEFAHRVICTAAASSTRSGRLWQGSWLAPIEFGSVDVAVPLPGIGEQELVLGAVELLDIDHHEVGVGMVLDRALADLGLVTHESRRWCC